MVYKAHTYYYTSQQLWACLLDNFEKLHPMRLHDYEDIFSDIPPLNVSVDI